MKAGVLRLTLLGALLAPVAAESANAAQQGDRARGAEVDAAASGAAKAAPAGQLQKATFGGGCFWCVEEAFDKVRGVVETTSGYTGGRTRNPTYEQVSDGGTGHAEVVQVLFDPQKVKYEELLDVFWHNIDPTTPNRQFCDKGDQYRSVIFTHDETQRALAEESKRRLEQSKRFKGKIFTEVVQVSEFYPAEDYHQDYYKKNPVRYKFYKYSCGRSQRLEKLWGKKA